MDKGYRDALLRDSSECGRQPLPKRRINSFPRVEGEILLNGAVQSFKGFLIRHNQIVPDSVFNRLFLKQEVQHLRKACSNCYFHG